MEIKTIRAGEQFISAHKILSWPVWQSPVAEFDWQYPESEACLFIEGKAVVSWPSGSVTVAAGDFVVFPRGLSCRWQVLEPVKKHYKFGFTGEGG